LVTLAELAGDTVYPGAVVLKFQDYIKKWEKFARKSKMEKYERETELLRVVEKGVVEKCKMGLRGCAVSIAEFLNNVSGNRRTQSAIKCMKNEGIEGSKSSRGVPWRNPPPVVAPSRGYVGGYRGDYRRPWGGRGGMARGDGPPPGLECFLCQQNHWVKVCPLKK
jgi:hypothetical protein